MSKNKKFYITTPIYYVNDKPHIGHAYTTIAADVLARYHRMKGEDVFFLTGTDENSQKNVLAAEKQGIKNIQKYIDEMSSRWQMTWDGLGFINNDFIRTTEERHKKGVKKFFEQVYKKGDIYKGIYEGFYCVGCEAFITKSDLIDGKCPIHKTEPKKIKEENYFFRASRYKNDLLKYIKKNPNFILPEERKNEIINYLKNHFEDISISRQSVRWGIPLPIDKTQVIYVWFDALINYLTGIGYGWDEKKFKKYWPADLHLVGKDIIKFHCALWPAMLMSADIDLPKKVFAHGFFTINGEKISKSLGNVIDPLDLTNKYGIDTIRYFLLREIPFGEDGDFSLKRLEERYNGDLANGLGNLTRRILTLVEKSGIQNLSYKEAVEGSSELILKQLKEKINETWKIYEEALEKLEFHLVLEAIWELLTFCDNYLEKEKPWELVEELIKGKEEIEGGASKEKEIQDELEIILYNLVESLRQISWLIWPFMPETAELILEQLGILDIERRKTFKEAKKWPEKWLGKIKRGEPMFPRIE